MTYQYKVVPAPERGEKVRGLKTPEERFAAAVERTINEMAADGWEYQRTDALPSEERSGLTQTQTVWRHLLVFRRGTGADQLARPAELVASSAPSAQEQRPEPAAEQPPNDMDEPETPEAETETQARPAAPARPLTATREGPRRTPRFAPPREDPAIAAPVRKLFAGPPRTHGVETHPADPRITRGKAGRDDDPQR